MRDAGMSEALRRMSIASNKLPAEVCNRAVFSMAIKAKKNMPVVSASKIQSELESQKIMPLMMSASGKRFLKAKKLLETVFFKEFGGAPLLALIIQSRVRSGGFWNIPSSPWAGVSRAEGAQQMLDAMRHVYNARVRSSGYFKACASVIYLVFKNSIGQSRPPESGGGVHSGEGSLSRRIGKIAGGTPATGKGKASATFWFASPTPDTKAAIYKIAQPVWERAMEDEAKFVMAKAIEKEYRDAAKAIGIRTN